MLKADICDMCHVCILLRVFPDGVVLSVCNNTEHIRTAFTMFGVKIQIFCTDKLKCLILYTMSVNIFAKMTAQKSGQFSDHYLMWLI